MTLQQKQFSETEIVFFDFASTSEERQIQVLLGENGLPFEDIHEHLIHFITAKKDQDVIGCVGLEIHGNQGLLRSLAVYEKYRGNEIATTLCNRILECAQELFLTDVYLLTETAKGFFEKLGFEQLDREKAPRRIKSTKEFSSLCSDGAIFMHRKIS